MTTIRTVIPAASLDAIGHEYVEQFDGCLVDPRRREEVEHAVTTVLRGRAMYEAVSYQTQVPWFFTGIVHLLECGSSFMLHLHNGDPLSARTVQVPKGRPVSGMPPFTWTDSAIDALRYEGINRWTDWSVAGLCWRFEQYNGMGYRKRSIPSPYLWAGSNQYVAGKFIADGVFSPGAVSKQVGAAVVLKSMINQRFLKLGDDGVIR